MLILRPVFLFELSDSEPECRNYSVPRPQYVCSFQVCFCHQVGCTDSKTSCTQRHIKSQERAALINGCGNKDFLLSCSFSGPLSAASKAAVKTTDYRSQGQVKTSLSVTDLFAF